MNAAVKLFKELHYERYESIEAYLKKLYSHTKGNFNYIVKHSSGITDIADLGRLKVLYNLSAYDLMLGIGRYKHMHGVTHTMTNLQELPLFCIDIDYSEEFAEEWTLSGMDPVDAVLWHVQHAGLPEPNFVEIGNRCRLIYILAQPVELVKGNRQRLLSGYRFLGRCFCTLLNEECSQLGAAPHLPTSFIRIPGSINSKTGAVVRAQAVSGVEFTLQELFDFIPEELIYPNGKEAKKAPERVIGRAKNGVQKMYNSFQLWRERKAWLNAIQGQCEHCRENFLFVYAQALLWTNEYEGVNDLISVNNRFKNPLKEKEIRSKFRTLKQYKLSNKAIEERLGVCMTKQAAYKERKMQEKIAAGQARFQRMERNRLATQACKQQGLTQAKAAIATGISLSAIKRLWNRTEPYTR